MNYTPAALLLVNNVCAFHRRTTTPNTLIESFTPGLSVDGRKLEGWYPPSPRRRRLTYGVRYSDGALARSHTSLGTAGCAIAAVGEFEPIPRVIRSYQAPSRTQTCWYLRGILNTRDIWLKVLRQMCEQRAVFFPSYPVNEMSLPRLQRASLAPHRFAQLLESNSHDTADLLPIIPEKSTKVWFGQPNQYEQSFLIPGGRFLIVGHEFTVSLWDLGPPDCAALQKPIRVARRKAETNMYRYLTRPFSYTRMAVRMVGEDTIRVAMAFGTLMSVYFGLLTRILLTSLHRVRCYEIRPNERSPSFDLLGTLLFDTRQDHAAGPLSVLLSDDAVFVEVEIGRSRNITVWYPKGRWYGFGPKRGAGSNRRVRGKVSDTSLCFPSQKRRPNHRFYPDDSQQPHNG